MKKAMFHRDKYKREKPKGSMAICITVHILFILLSVRYGHAQKQASIIRLPVHAMAKAYGDSVVIRWAPGSATAWKLGNDSGYQVIRVDYTDPGRPLRTLLTPEPLMPMSLPEMKAHLDTANKYAAIAAQALYGNNFELTGTPPATFAGRVTQGRSAMNFRFTFAMMCADFSAPVAGAMALRWVDSHVKKGGVYRYIVFSRGAEGQFVLDSASVSLVNVKPKKTAVPEGLAAYGFDRKAELHWNRRQLPPYDAYNIERSDDHGKTYHLLNKNPFYAPYELPPAGKADSLEGKIASVLRDHQVFFDSLPRNYKTYYYRISGLNAFGEQTPYTRDTVAVHGIDLTPPVAPTIDSVSNISGSNMKITWRRPESSPDLMGYIVTRSHNPRGPFYPIEPALISVADSTFVDTSAVAHLPNYYVVVATDSAGNTSESLPKVAYLTDSLPPAPPTGVAGTIDSSGVVHLQWNKSTEPDLKGYKVYYSYVPDQEFSQVTHFAISGNSYTDTIPMNTLDRKIYYRVAAVDRNNNHSDYSASAELKKPVVIAPSAPEPGDIVTDSSGVRIEWIESRSEGAAGYEVFRQEAGKSWQPVARLPQDWSVTSIGFRDSTIQPNTDYYYAAETIDSTGIHSDRSFTVHVRDNAAHTLPRPGSPDARWDPEKKVVRLNWGYSRDSDYFFILYRGLQAGGLVPWHSFDRATTSCQDTQVRGGVYRYAIKVVSQDHKTSSELSKPVVVNTDDRAR